MRAAGVKEAMMILPIANNDGVGLELVHKQLKRELCKAFGGYTAQPVEGGWLDDEGRLYEDKSIAYTVAMGSTKWMALNNIAKRFCALAEQKCIYVRYPTGNVAFVKAEETAETFNTAGLDEVIAA